MRLSVRSGASAFAAAALFVTALIAHPSMATNLSSDWSTGIDVGADSSDEDHGVHTSSATATDNYGAADDYDIIAPDGDTATFEDLYYDEGDDKVYLVMEDAANAANLNGYWLAVFNGTDVNADFSLKLSASTLTSATHELADGDPSWDDGDRLTLRVYSFDPSTGPNSGGFSAVTGDQPAEALPFIRDYGFEWAPNVMTVIGAIFALVLTFGLIRMGLARVRGAMRA